MKAHLLSFLFVLQAAATLPAQSELNKFIVAFEEAQTFQEDKRIDKVVKALPTMAVLHFLNLRWDFNIGNKDRSPKLDILKASWSRCFDKSTTLEKVERWVDGMDRVGYDAFLKLRDITLMAAMRALREAEAQQKREPYREIYASMLKLATQMEETGNKVKAAAVWLDVAACLSRIPDKTVEDRKDILFATQQFLSQRQSWEFTGDGTYLTNFNFVKGETEVIEAANKARDKRKSEGYDAEAKGIDAMVMPGARDEQHDTTFEMLANWEELDYCAKGGPAPVFWWMAQTQAAGTSSKLTWFTSRELYLVRTGATKFGMSPKPDDPKHVSEVEVGNKGKPTQFFVDEDKKIPYAMFFWTGGDKEHIGDIESNLSPQQNLASVYYRSAASWKITVGTEAITLYDDNASGVPADGDPFEVEFKSKTYGNPTGGIDMPRLDSMRVGKGPRVPFSEFVQVGGSWFWLHRQKPKTEGNIAPAHHEERICTKPLNPEYVKPGKLKLSWSGPKPAQLVVQGRGDLKTACFELAGGKEVEVPSGEYRVIFGRIVQGKGAKVMMATIAEGDGKPIAVEAGKTTELKMGAPFSIRFQRGGTDAEPSIDGLTVRLREVSGCDLVQLNGMTVVPEVLAAKAADGKGAKTIGKFGKWEDIELINKVAAKYPDIGLMAACFPMPEGSKDGSTDLKLKAGAGMKLGLYMKKHPLFGELKSEFQ